MTTAVDIANMAIALLEEAPIESLEEDSKVARLLKVHYEVVREAELMKRPWGFALVTVDLVGTDTDSGSGTLNWRYTLPSDMLRLMPLTYDNTVEGVEISWEIRDGYLYSDQESPRGIRYIANVTDPDDWNALFIDVMAAALAVKIALPLTHKAGMLELAQKAYDRALVEAIRVNASERRGRLHTTSWTRLRGDTRVWRA